jgi:hypothetical protein
MESKTVEFSAPFKIMKTFFLARKHEVEKKKVFGKIPVENSKNFALFIIQ